MDFIKESMSLLINTNKKSHEKELCLRNTRALRPSLFTCPWSHMSSRMRSHIKGSKRLSISIHLVFC